MRDVLLAAELGRAGAPDEYIELALCEKHNEVKSAVEVWSRSYVDDDETLRRSGFAKAAWDGDMQQMRANSTMTDREAMLEVFGGEAFR